MAKKCDNCGEKIEITFLGKIIGTKIGKKYYCDKCQSIKENKFE